MDLTTRGRVLVRLNVDGDPLSIDPTDADDPIAAWLDEAVTYWSARAVKDMNRQVTLATYTEYLDVEPNQHVWSLKAYPVTTVSQVTHDTQRDFDSGDLDSDDYSCQTGCGLLRVDGYYTHPAPGALRVIYRGGMSATGGATFAAAYPDLAGALDMQIAYAYTRRGREGQESVSTGVGQSSYIGAMDWLPHVRSVLRQYRRVDVGR